MHEEPLTLFIKCNMYVLYHYQNIFFEFVIYDKG